MLYWKLMISLVEEGCFKKPHWLILFWSTSMHFGLNSGTWFIVDRGRFVSEWWSTSMYVPKGKYSVDPRVFQTQWMCLVFNFGQSTPNPTPWTWKKKQPLEKRDSFMETIIFQIPCQTSGVYISENSRPVCFLPRTSRRGQSQCREYWDLIGVSVAGGGFEWIWYVRPRKFSHSWFSLPSKCHHPDFQILTVVGNP